MIFLCSDILPHFVAFVWTWSDRIDVYGSEFPLSFCLLCLRSSQSLWTSAFAMFDTHCRFTETVSWSFPFLECSKLISVSSDQRIGLVNRNLLSESVWVIDILFLLCCKFSAVILMSWFCLYGPGLLMLSSTVNNFFKNLSDGQIYVYNVVFHLD